MYKFIVLEGLKMNSTAYKNQYSKENYKSICLKIRDQEYNILKGFCKDLGMSQTSLLMKCMTYCYENMIDVSKVKLSSPDKD